MARTAVLGFPRIGAERELKTALEDFWAGGSDAETLETTASAVRADNLVAGARAGIDVLPVGDFALYDHVLDAAELFGIRAERHRGLEPTALSPTSWPAAAPRASRRSSSPSGSTRTTTTSSRS